MNTLWMSIELIKFGIISGIFLGISFAFTAPFLILRKNSLFPHALTHILFFAILSVSALPLISSELLQYFLIFGIAMLASSSILLFKRLRIYEDTATAIITHFFLALGLIIAAKTSRYDARLLSYLFGSIIGITKIELYQSIFLLAMTLLLFFKFSPLWTTQTTDEAVPGVNFQLANFFYLSLLTFQILTGIKVMGILLVSVFFVFSGAMALKLGKTLKKVILFTGLFNIFGVLGGVLLSVFWDLPFSAAVVVFMGACFFTTSVLKELKNRGRIR